MYIYFIIIGIIRYSVIISEDLTFLRMAPRRQPGSLCQQCVYQLSQQLDVLCATHLHSPDHPHLLIAVAYLDSVLPVPLQAAIGTWMFCGHVGLCWPHYTM